MNTKWCDVTKKGWTKKCVHICFSLQSSFKGDNLNRKHGRAIMPALQTPSWPDLHGSRTKHPGTKHPMPFFTPRTKHPTKICHPGQNIPCCFCHPGHNIPCHFCYPGHNIPCHFCHPGQNIPYSDCFFRVSLICALHLLWHVLAVNALVWLSKWYKLDLKLIERQFHNLIEFN